MALAVRGLAAPGLLESYTAERQPVIAEMLRRTTAILDAAVQRAPTTSISHPPLADASAAGPAAIPAPAPPASTSGAPVTDAWTRGRELQMLGVNYEWSALAVDDSRARPSVAAAAARAYLPDPPLGAELRAGDRAPDAPGLRVLRAGPGGWPAAGKGATASLFDAFRPSWHTVLLFCGRSADATAREALLAVIRQQPGDVVRTILVLQEESTEATHAAGDADAVVLDAEQYAFAHYGISPDATVSAVVVRPDSYIGAFVRKPVGLKEYFRLIFSSI
jgi:hypothetical protein